MGNEESVPAIAEDVEVEEEVQKLRKELKKENKTKRKWRKIGGEQEAQGGNYEFKKRKNRINKKIRGQWEAESRFGAAATNKNGAAPEQLEPRYRANKTAM